MEARIIVSIEDLRRAALRILDDLEREQGATLAVERDYFWSIPPEHLYNVYAAPPDLTIGQLSESWKNVQDIANGSSPPVAYALVWVGDLLRAIGQEVVG